MKLRKAVALAAGAMAAASVTLAADTARADLVTLCVGTGGAVTVPGDLVVPAGKSCVLEGTTVNGDVRVARNSNLITTGGTLNGAVRVATNGYLDTAGTTISGQVVLASGGFGVYLQESQVDGRVFARPQGRSSVVGFVFVERTVVNGPVVARVGEVRLDGAEIARAVRTDGTVYTDVHRSFVDGALSVSNSATGSVVCGSAVRGNATFADNGQGVQLGTNGTLDSCAAGGFWGGDVAITATTGQAHVDDNIINGTLAFADNDPVATVGSANLIRGGITGEHNSGASAQVMSVPDRTSELDQRAQGRRAQATADATSSGPARL